MTSFSQALRPSLARAALLCLCGITALAACAGAGTLPRADPAVREAGAEPGRAQATLPHLQPNTATPLDAVILARRMARYGRHTRSPLALLAAAQILLDYPPQPLSDSPDPGADQRRVVSDPEWETDAASLLTAARALAAGDDAVLSMVRVLEARLNDVRARGATAGPRQTFGHLAPGARQFYTINFSGNRDAVVYASGDAGGPLELAVYEPGGAHVVSDRGRGDESVVRWTPVRTTPFRVEVRNSGTEPSWYILLTN